MRIDLEYGGKTYQYTESRGRARLMEGDTVLWWGPLEPGIPSHTAPLVVLLRLSLAKIGVWT